MELDPDHFLEVDQAIAERKKVFIAEGREIKKTRAKSLSFEAIRANDRQGTYPITVPIAREKPW
jgi:hypothetical protein